MRSDFKHWVLSSQIAEFVNEISYQNVTAKCSHGFGTTVTSNGIFDTCACQVGVNKDLVSVNFVSIIKWGSEPHFNERPVQCRDWCNHSCWILGWY